MELETKIKLPTTNYKGTRDFFPNDMKLRNWMFSIMREVVTRYGYLEYDGPILESLELYKAKSGEEIEKQLYSFVDKGGRHVAIRPEMTPTLARMVASKLRELPRPIRWFSIPNLWRYENPGHGRLREHWQLNVDLFGVNYWTAELEIIRLACDILFAFGANNKDFRVNFSHREILNNFLQKTLKLEPKKEYAVAKLLDKKNKISKQEFESQILDLLPNSNQDLEVLYKFLSSNLENILEIPNIDIKVLKELKEFYKAIEKLGLKDTVFFDPSIIRGFDYYTGFIFEIFDTDPKNKRSLYGGGRYDNLISLFSNEQVSGIGFGLGDVTLQNFLSVHNLLPSFQSQAGVYLGILGEKVFFSGMELAGNLRKEGLLCETNLDLNVKLSKLIPQVEKKGYRYMLLFGEEELESSSIILKDLNENTQKKLPLVEIISEVKRLKF